MGPSRWRSEPASCRPSDPRPNAHPRLISDLRAQFPRHRRLRAWHAHLRGRRHGPDDLLGPARPLARDQLYWRRRRPERETAGAAADGGVRGVRADLGRGPGWDTRVRGIRICEHGRVRYGLLDHVLRDGRDVQRSGSLFLLYSWVCISSRSVGGRWVYAWGADVYDAYRHPSKEGHQLMVDYIEEVLTRCIRP